MALPDDATWEWLVAQIGHAESVFEFGHDHGYSKLWRVRAGSQYYWLKMHNFATKWAGEVHALAKWGPRIGKSPYLVAFKDEPRAAILSEVPGVNAEAIEFSLSGELRMWSQAGDWLRQLHAIKNNWFGAIDPDGAPNGTPTGDPVEFVRASFDQRLREGRDLDLLAPDEIEFVEAALRVWMPALQDEGACAIHRDFTPRNWMATEGELTAVIDFEHARWDVRAADLNRCWDLEFLRRPALASAFFEAYGNPDDRLTAQIKVTRLGNAVSGVVWATKVKDLPFAQHNREALQRIMLENPNMR